MADKPISELPAASAFTQSDLLVTEQNGEAKSVTGQVLMRDLAKMLDGHGGIKNIALASTAGLVDTYEITTTDGTVFTYSVTNGKDGKDGATGPRGASGNPRNWLDNSDFSNIVNQRGGSAYHYSEHFCVDRWLLGGGGTMEVTNGTVICNGAFMQYLSDEARAYLYEKTVTVFIQDDFGYQYIASGDFKSGFVSNQGDVVITLSSDSLEINVVNGSLYFPKIALYEGAYTAEDIPEYQPKEYAVELLECQRYYRRYNPYCIMAMGYVDATGAISFSLPISVQFLETPTPNSLAGACIWINGEFFYVADDNNAVPQITVKDLNTVQLRLSNQVTRDDLAYQMVLVELVGNPFVLSCEKTYWE